MSQFEQHLANGSVLDHNFRIEKMLGQGGFGITYLATDIALNRPVAIKEFFPKDFCNRDNDTSQVTVATMSNAELVDRLKIKFLKEARNIAKFNCPYIIKIYAAFQANNTAYYVMEYIEGENLNDMVRRDGPLPVDRAVDYVKKIGEALEYIHAQHLNHLDVKPANIMVRRSDNRPLLIDFGLSKEYNAQGHQTSTTPTGISHGYAPIEQYNSEGLNQFSPESDLYSLGATLYYLLTGTRPPEAARLLNEPLTFPPTVPAYLQRAISRAMATTKKHRHQSVREFVHEITNPGMTGESTVFAPSASAPYISEATSYAAPVMGGTSYGTQGMASPAPSVHITSPNTQHPADSKNNGGSKKYVVIAIVAVGVILAAIGIILGLSKSGNQETLYVHTDGTVTSTPANTTNAEATAQPAASAESDVINEDVAPRAEVKEPEPAILNDSPYPIAPGTHSFSGTADGKYPIIATIKVSSNGSVTCKLAYKSTLKKYGDKDKNYMKYSGDFSGDDLHLYSSDEHNEEWDVSVSDNGKEYKIKGTVYNYNHGNSYSVSMTGK